MPIPPLNLDNRTFDDLSKEMRALIAGYCPEWTDHNASDPGIMLVELFAWVTENLLYRMNRVPPAGEQVLLRLLGQSGTDPIDQERAATRATLQGRWRAVTADDFEALVLEQFPAVARARCLADVAVDSQNPDVLTSKTGHVSVIIVPYSADGRIKAIPDPALVDAVYAFLDERRLVTCRHHVSGPVYADIAIGASVVCESGRNPDDVQARMLAGLKNFYAPVGVADGEGWSFGRDVYESEACAVIEGTEGVDHVEALTLLQKQGVSWVEADGKIPVGPHRLVCFDEAASLARSRIVSK